MKIDVFEKLTQLTYLKPAWNELYAHDKKATFFLSWAWLFGWLERTSHQWLILGLRSTSTSPYVAFLPLVLRVRPDWRSKLVRELALGGYPMADYTGFLCSSEYEEKAMSAFAYYIKRKIKWERFRLNGVLDERLERFLLEFDSKEFDTVELTQTGCPYINLPSSWDQYLTASLGPKTRRNVRRSFTEMENVDDLTVTVADKTNLVPQVDALLALWQKRWGSKQRNYLDHIHNVFESCHHNDCLRIMLLWDMNTPVAGVASFPDRHRQTIFEFFNCYNASYTQIRSPGQLAVAHNIRYAIDHGFQKYDFLRGDEKYKYALGAEERYASNVIILRKALGTKLRILADRGLARIERFKAFE